RGRSGAVTAPGTRPGVRRLRRRRSPTVPAGSRRPPVPGPGCRRRREERRRGRGLAARDGDLATGRAPRRERGGRPGGPLGLRLEPRRERRVGRAPARDEEPAQEPRRQERDGDDLARAIRDAQGERLRGGGGRGSARGEPGADAADEPAESRGPGHRPAETQPPCQRRPAPPSARRSAAGRARAATAVYDGAYGGRPDRDGGQAPGPGRSAQASTPVQAPASTATIAYGAPPPKAAAA